MKAVTMHGLKDVRVEDVPRPELQEPTDVILRMTTAAICGSDLHLYHDKMPGLLPGSVVGHEFLGVVEEVGAAVRLVEAGQRYVASFYPACGSCAACMRHDWRNCPFFAVFGFGEAFGSLDGSQAEYVRVPLADMTLAPVPDSLSDEQALFTGDILSTAFTGVLKSGLQAGQTLAIVGAGPVGLLAVQCAQLVGPSKVFSIDLVPERLKLAESFGAIPINAADGDPSDAVFEQTGFLGVDVVIEAVGNAKSLEVAWSLARTGATIAIVGVLVDEPWPISCGDNWLRSLTIKPILGDCLTYRYDILKLIEAGKLRPEAIISHTMRLDDATEAYEMFDSRQATKILLKP